MIDIADPRSSENIRVKLNAVIQNEEFAENLERGFKLHHQTTINKVIKEIKTRGS
jgi:hypothetical protein